MREINTLEDVVGIKAGESYIFTGYPDPPVTDEEIEKFDDNFAAAQKLEASLEQAIADELAKASGTYKYTKTELNKMREAQVVEIALSLGLEASVRDRKSDTIKRILEAQS